MLKGAKQKLWNIPSTSTEKGFKIMGIPAFRYFHNGELVHKSVGGMDTEMIHAQLSRLLYHD